MHEKRTYRNLVKTDDLIKLEVLVKETDLLRKDEIGRNVNRVNMNQLG